MFEYFLRYSNVDVEVSNWFWTVKKNHKWEQEILELLTQFRLQYCVGKPVCKILVTLSWSFFLATQYQYETKFVSSHSISISNQCWHLEKFPSVYFSGFFFELLCHYSSPTMRWIKITCENKLFSIEVI